jgi:hypothetical protein
MGGPIVACYMTDLHAQKLDSSFRQGLALPRTYDVRSAEYDKTRQWDSVAHLLLLMAIEESFSIHLDPAEVIELSSYDKAVAILRRHGAWPDD